MGATKKMNYYKIIGEFRKRIGEKGKFIEYGPDFIHIDKLEKMLEEAKQDFPMLDCDYDKTKNICTKNMDKKIKYPHPEDCCDCNGNLNGKREDWLERWFGETVKE